MGSGGDESRSSRGLARAIGCSLLFLLGALVQSVSAGEVSLVHRSTFGQRNFVITACGGQSANGCTVFSGFRLACICSFEDEWRIRFRIDGSAQTYLSSAAYVGHEFRHVADVRSRLDAYAAQLGSARFASSLDCDHAADAAARSFEGFVKDAIRKTVDHLDLNQPTAVSLDIKRH